MHDRTLNLDVTDAEVRKLSLGDKVVVKVEGLVTVLRAKEKMDLMPPTGKKEKPEVYPPEITVKVSKMSVTPEGNEFAKLAEEEDDD